ncbi:hypothetical protein FRB96_009402 [Tulasnella sp. 330]|nr:hypothetical protein FRB96_009402 [Tulasnella sp. 330]KAG8884717.1 hypothetical protein FRB97_003501 [Tulasnella sp. 331]KAG8889692.1 hypothetical protein FRB98_003255 [Tulasnella sp. 332]
MYVVPHSEKGGLDSKDVKKNGTGDKLAALRKLMKDEPTSLDYYIIPSADAHQSEYICAADARVEYISDFTGSSALAIVSTASAHLFVDSRYWVQAAREIDDNWTLHRVGAPGEKDWIDWVKQDANPMSVFGVDSRLIPYRTVPQLFSRIAERGSRLLFPKSNLIDASRSDRPPLPNSPITVHPIKYAGQPASAKIKQIREWLLSQRSPERSTVFEVLPGELPDEHGSPSSTSHTYADILSSRAAPNGVLMYALDTIAWTLNLRGADVPFNPVFFAYLIITQDEVILFTEPGKIGDEDVKAQIESLGINILPYEEVWSYLQSDNLKGTIILDSGTPYAVASSLKRPTRYSVVNYCYAVTLKGTKNDTEIKGFRAAYLRDAAAFVQWSAWLEEAVVKKKLPITEWDAAQKLDDYRKRLEHYRGLAYGNISATGANAALPHYEPSDEASPVIETATPYLMDSGGQYLDGTCDTTRTVHFGDPTKEQKEAYTRVLQGHIAIETAVFPYGTTGAHLDVLARKALWKDGLNYGHGTGHGFGSFLSVHEGPHGFGISVPLKAGNVITNEPGYYKEGEFGIRIESALLVKEVKFEGSGRGAGHELPWFEFERFTQVPIQASRLISFSLLTKEERKWLRNHNKTCLEKLRPILKDDKRAMTWLKKQTGKVGPIEIFWE